MCLFVVRRALFCCLLYVDCGALCVFRVSCAFCALNVICLLVSCFVRFVRCVCFVYVFGVLCCLLIVV